MPDNNVLELPDTGTSSRFDPNLPFEKLDGHPPAFDPAQPFEAEKPAVAPRFDPSQEHEKIGGPDASAAQALGIATAAAAGATMSPGAALIEPIIQGVGGKPVDMAVESGLPIIGGIVGAAGGPAGIAAGGAAGGAAGTSLREMREMARGERGEFSTGQVAGAGIIGAIPLGKVAEAGASIGKQVLRRGVQGAVTGVANKAIETAIDEQRLPTATEARESAVGGGLIGGALGAGEQAVANGAVKRVVDWFRTRITPQSVLGDEITSAIKDAGAGVRAEIYKAERRASDVEDQLKVLPGDTRGAARETLQQFLTGKSSIEKLPEVLRPAAQAMRDHIDELTDRAINEGVVDGLTRETFLNNRGQYLRRSYRLFSDPDYRPSPEIFDAAVKDIMDTDRIGRGEAINVANELLDRRTADSLFSGGKRKDGKDISSLMLKDDIRAPIRELLGEVKDPVVNYGQTIPRMARLIEFDNAQRQIAEAGERLGLFSKQSDAERYTTRLAGADDGRLNRYGGLWTSPDVKAALENLGEMPANGALERGLAAAMSVSKAGKTLLNPEAYAPNLFGSALMTAANGHVGFHRAGDGVLLMAEELGFLKNFGKQVDRERVRDIADKMIRLRVLDSSVSANDLAGSVERGFTSNVRAVSKYLLRPFGSVWQGSDNIAKLVAFQGERARYAKAFPNMTPSQLDEKAAQVVRATMPNYAEIPPWVRKASERGIVQPFVSFTWEMYRNAANIARIGAADIALGRKQGNQALVNAGLRRLVPFMVALGASSPIGLTMLSRKKAGMNAEDEKAARFFAPDWDRDGSLVWNDFKRGREYSYSNQSYLLPHSIVMQAIDAGLHGDDPVGAYWKSMGEQFLGGNLVIDPLAEAITGTRVVNGSFPRVAHLSGVTAPGSSSRMAGESTGGNADEAATAIASFTVGFCTKPTW